MRIQELLREELSQAGYHVVSAYSGEEGLEYAQKSPPHAIVLDLMMPGMDGFQVADALMENDHTRVIPLVILTAKDLSRDERKRLLASADTLLSKSPDRRQRLLNAVRDISQRSEARKTGNG